jgi:hypothetical protein
MIITQTGTGAGALALAQALDYDPNHVLSLVTIAVPSALNSLFPAEHFHNSTQVHCSTIVALPCCTQKILT